MKKLLPAMLVSSIGLLASNQANAVLSTIGLPDPINHYPSSITDTNNVALQLCLDGDPLLGICGFDPIANAGTPWAALVGFGNEAFYNRAQAKLAMPNGRRAVYSAGVEGAYLPAVAADGNQFVFGRVRFRADLPGPGQYKISHPFMKAPGCQPYIHNEPVGGKKALDITVDVGGNTPFTNVLTADSGPFLKWDPAIAPLAPAGYIGDVRIAHEIKGSACGFNAFQINGPNINGPGTTTISTNLFNITGKIATLANVPLVIDRATYKRDAAGVSLSVFAGSAPTSTVTLNAQVGGYPATVLATNLAGNFFTRLASAIVPASVSVSATSPVAGAAPTVATLPVTDEVDVIPAVYTPATQSIVISATTSVVVTPFPALTATVGKTPFPMTRNDVTGVYTVTIGALPAPPVSVTVTSSLGGKDLENIAE